MFYNFYSPNYIFYFVIVIGVAYEGIYGRGDFAVLIWHIMAKNA